MGETRAPVRSILLAFISVAIALTFGCTPPRQSKGAAKWQSPLHAKGFRVSIAELSNTGPCGDSDRALVSFVSGEGHFHLNGESYSDRQQFGSELESLLLRRDDRSVYVIANPGVEFREVIDVLDELGNRKARIVLLTHAVAEDPKNCGPVWLPNPPK